MKKLSVLYLTNAPSPYRVEFFEELGKLCDLNVCFELKPEDVKHRNTAWYKESYTNFTSIQLRKRYFFKQYICTDVLKVLKEKKYDAVVVGVYSTNTALLAMAYLKLKRIPFFINSDGGFIQKNETIVKKCIKSFLIGLGSYYFASGEKTGDYLRYYGGNKQVFKYSFSTYLAKDLPKNLISCDEKEQLKKKLNLLERYVFISVGQFIYRKGYDILMRACVGLSKDVGIYIIGGEPTEEYVQLKNSLKLNNIHFIGFKKKENLIEYYKAADAFVLPTREDIWGLVINEALTYGLPVITTDNCLAGLELVENGVNGYIVPVGDTVELRKKIELLSENLELSNYMASNAFGAMQTYTIEQEAIDHINAFTEVIKLKKR